MNIDSVTENAEIGLKRPAKRISGPAARTAPHSLEAEQGVLGCILQNPDECLGQCVVGLHGGPEAFYDIRHKTIYETMLTMSDSASHRPEPIEIVTLQQRLKDGGLLEQVGGIPYLNELIDSIPSAANLSYYLNYVNEKYLLRKTSQVLAQGVEDCYSTEAAADVTALLDRIERDVLAVRPMARNSNSIKELVHRAIGLAEDRLKADGITGLTTHLSDLDRKSDGMHRGEMIVVAGFPSTGKTALACNIAINLAVQCNLPVAIFSAEMLPESIVDRALHSLARANRRRLMERDIPHLTNAAGRLSKAPIHVEPANGMTIGQLVATARRLHQKHGLKLVVVDYIQLISGEGDNREQQISDVSKGIKAMALELGIPVLALSQLTDDGKLRESRAIGQDADSVWKLINNGAWQSRVQPIFLNIEKCREGETGVVELVFVKEHTRFECVAKISDDDVPRNPTAD